MRGEDPVSYFFSPDVQETPPRAWGRHHRLSRNGEFTRNTPTCVGKTVNKTSEQILSEKHPHVRGEDLIQMTPILLSEETPPRAWGRHLLTASVSVSHGNTPTCVGKTLHRYRQKKAFGKHPHVRGEDSSDFFFKIASRETPPRAWGRP